MKTFNMGDRIIDTKTNKSGTYKGLSVGQHLPLVEFDGDNKFIELENADDLELIQ